jgi:hypothetical protein
MKKSLFIISNLFLLSGLSSLPVNSQTVNFMPTELIAEPGEQKTNNLSSGTTESLRISTSSTFGSSTNVSTTSGFTVNSKSSLKPIQATIVGEFGSTEGKMSVDVGNIRTEGTGKHTASSTSSSFDIDATDSTITEGFSNIEGITSTVNLEIDPIETTTEVDIEDIGESDTDNMKTANGAANQNLQNSLSVDISNSTFNSSFSQAF